MKVLNLYACLGGNRLLWDNCQVTAVELDPYLCELYQERFPNDIVINADAHEFLLNNYNDYEFIWSSPPCPTHSRARMPAMKNGKTIPVYPDMTLYQEIILLENFFNGKYCVENVIPYYDLLIPGYKRGRHIFWTNFPLPAILSKRKGVKIGGKDELKMWSEFHRYDFTKYKGQQRVLKIARNLVDYEAGKTIFEAARGALNCKSKQLCLF